MKPERYEAWAGDRRRLTGFLQSRSPTTGLPAWGKFFFGIPFLAAGAWMILVGTKSVPAEPSSVHAPYWVVTAAGVSFALAGLMGWGLAWQHLATNRQRVWASRQHLHEPALRDYPWHPDGFTLSQWTGVATIVGLALGMTVFLSLFNWWAFWGPQGWMLKAVVVLLDCIGLVMWWQAMLRLARALKFGQSRIVFSRFPYRLGEPIHIRWRPAAGIHHVRRGSFTLRCVEEWLEWRGVPGHRSRNLVQEEVWSGTWVLDQPRTFQLKDEVELHYEPPAEAPPTRLSAAKPVFWELEVELELQGPDFRGKYLVPVYGPKTAVLPAAESELLPGKELAASPKT